jgi:protein required for attachment to host cells
MSGVMIDHNAWVMVGDGQKALFFRNAGDATYPNLEIVQVLQQDNPSTSEQSSDRPGRTHSSNGTARSAMQETNWHKLEKHRFAMNIADAPYSAAHSGRYDKLVTAAPHPPRMIMGDLRKAIRKELSDKVVAEMSKDLTNMPPHEIEKKPRRDNEQGSCAMTRTQQSSDQVRAVDLEMGGDDGTPGISQELTTDNIDDIAFNGAISVEERR